MGSLGLFVGGPLILLSLMFGSLSALVIMPFIKKKTEEGGFAFGPFLAIGVIIAIFFGNDLINWYFGLFSV